MTATPRATKVFSIVDATGKSKFIELKDIDPILGYPVVEHDFGGIVGKVALAMNFGIRPEPITWEANFTPTCFDSLVKELGDPETRIDLFPYGNKWYLPHYQCDAGASTLNDDGSIRFDAKRWRDLTNYSRKAKVLRWLWHKVVHPVVYYFFKVWDRLA